MYRQPRTKPNPRLRSSNTASPAFADYVARTSLRSLNTSDGTNPRAFGFSVALGSTTGPTERVASRSEVTVYGHTYCGYRGDCDNRDKTKKKGILDHCHALLVFADLVEELEHLGHHHTPVLLGLVQC